MKIVVLLLWANSKEVRLLPAEQAKDRTMSSTAALTIKAISKLKLAINKMRILRIRRRVILLLRRSYRDSFKEAKGKVRDKARDSSKIRTRKPNSRRLMKSKQMNLRKQSTKKLKLI